MYNAEHACCGLTITETCAAALFFSITNLPAGTLSKRFWEDVYFQVTITITTITAICMMPNTPVAG